MGTSDADSLLNEAASARPGGAIAKLRYSHEAMLDLIIANPGISQNQLAATFGYSPPWVCQIIASDAFQERLAARREEIIDPAIRATLEERFRALVFRSIEILQAKLSQPVVSDNVALRAAELGAKALGLGGHAAAPVQAVVDLEQLANRLVYLKRNSEKEISGEVIQQAAAAAAG